MKGNFYVGVLFVLFMADSKDLHEEILKWVEEEYGDILSDSKQAIYVYVCDRHKLCNQKFSSLLGYSSPEEWAMKEDAVSDVKDDDQSVLISAYKNAMEQKIGSNIIISWKNKKKGNLIKTNVILVPQSYKGELFALHFVTKI